MSSINKSHLKKLLKDLNSTPSGLSHSTSLINKEKFGSNVIDEKKSSNFFMKFLMQFKNLMVIILLLSAIISLSMAIVNSNYSDLFEGLLILGIVIINAFVGAIQEKKAENTLELLKKKICVKSKVYRDGKLIHLEINDIVVGDIIELKTGDMIPADIRLIETNNFSCNESSLTGESKKVKKDASAIYQPKELNINHSNMCFKGTTVSSGNAKGVVVSVGKSTEIGKIANLISTKRKEKTPLEKNIDKIGKIITIGVTIIVLIVFIVQLLFSENINFGDAFMTAIALAVAAIPESLPAVITIIMALGVQKLGKHNAIVKTLSSVETLGCCNCICSDKTGTLTQNQMSVVDIFTSNKLIEKNKFHKEKAIIENVFFISSLCSNAQIISEKNIVGDATEKAIIELCINNSYEVQKIRNEYQRIKEFPFDSTTKKMTTINKRPDGTYFACIKGAFDYLIDKCTHIEINGKIKVLDQNNKNLIIQNHNALTHKAERVLMLAKKDLLSQDDDVENNLIFVAILGLIDPPRPEVYDAIKICHKSGMKPIMITGDHKETAFAIAKELKIAKSQSEVITGKELNNLSDSDLKKIVSKFSVFARVTPEHKLKIVTALKNNGNVVAMTGDGVNDAPSIKQADIGVCMGKTGTDVTKSVSDLIITDDNFATIVLAVSEGRTIYNNIRKTLQFLISTNAVEVIGLLVVSLIIRDSIFLLPSQILFINLITDSLPAFALGIEPPEKNIMERPPRKSSDDIFSGDTGTAIIYQAFIQSLVVLIMFVWAYHTQGNDIATTMSFLTICLMQILHAVNCKTNKSLLSINIFENKFFNISFLALFTLIMIVSLFPPIASIFSLVQLSLKNWIIVFLTSLSIIPLVELCKLILKTNKI